MSKKILHTVYIHYLIHKERHNFILTFKAVCGGKQTAKPDYYNMKDKKNA